MHLVAPHWGADSEAEAKRDQQLEAAPWLERFMRMEHGGVVAPKLLADQEGVTLKVEVLGLDDKPLDGLAYLIEAPDAETHEGDLGASAKTKITCAKKGTAGVTLKWAEAEA